MRAVATLMCIDVQEMLASNDFIPSILKFTYNTNKVTKEHQKKIKKFMSNHDFTSERVNSECKVCGPLVKWFRSQVRMAGLLFYHMGPLTQEIKKLEDTVVDKQKEADALHATVNEQEIKKLEDTVVDKQKEADALHATVNEQEIKKLE
eukprot:49422_1